MYLGIDIGGSAIKYAVFDDKFNLIDSFKRTTPLTSIDDLLDSLEIEVKKVENLLGVGIACPGTVHHDLGVVYYGGALRYLHDVRLKERCQERFKVPVSVENDGKAATLGELTSGALRGKKSAIALILGSGVGGGIIIDSKLVKGKNHFAGEFSYMNDEGVFSMERFEAMLGYRGSAVLMIKNIAQALGIEEDGKSVFGYIHEGNPIAVEIFKKYCKFIAEKIVNLNYLLDVETIVIGGGISDQEIVVETIKEYVQSMIPPYLFISPEVVKCELGSHANVYGAIAPFRK